MISEEFVGDDGLLLLVPQHRHCHPARIGRIRLGVDLVQIVEAIERVAGGAILGQEGPAILAHEMVHDRNRDDVFQLLQRAEDQGAVRPRASPGDIEVITAGLDLEAACLAGCRTAIWAYPVAPLRLRAHETAARILGVIPTIHPFSVDQQSHDRLLRVSNSI